MDTRTICEVFSKLVIKTLERRNRRHSGAFIVNFEQISHVVPVFPLLHWTNKYRLGMTWIRWFIFYLLLLLYQKLCNSCSNSRKLIFPQLVKKVSSFVRTSTITSRTTYPAGIYLFKVNNRNTYEIEQCVKSVQS